MTCSPCYPHFLGKPCVVLSAKLKWAHRPCQGPRGILVGAKALTNLQIFLEIHFQEITLSWFSQGAGLAPPPLLLLLQAL